MKSFSTKSDIFNWSVVRSQQSDVLRLRGGTGSPSPSPPPTRPTSPTPVPAVSIIRPVASIRSRSNLRRTEDLSPVRRHTAPTQASDLPRSRRETSVVTKKQVAVAIGSYQVRRGLFTVVRLNRLNVGDWRNQVLTRLDDTRTQGIGDQYLGTLIGVVSHQGNPQGGHYIAYSRVNNQWHLNSDAAHVRQVGYHPFNPTNQNETVGLLVYKNN